MLVNNICVGVFLSVWTLLVLWANYEVWFRPEKVLERMQEDPYKGVRDISWLLRFLPAEDDHSKDRPQTESLWLIRVVLVLMDIGAIVAWSIFLQQIAVKG